MKSSSITTALIFSLLILLGCKKESPVASFTSNTSMAAVGETVTFSNLSENSTDYIWDFGDENASAELNPTHVYEEVGLYTVELTAYGNGTKDVSADTIEVVPPPANIEPGVRIGDFYLTDDLKTHFAKLDETKLDYFYFLRSNGQHGHIFTFADAGISFYLFTPTEDYTIDDVPSRIEVNPPFDGWAMGGITFGTSFVDVANAFGSHVTTTGDHFYDGIIFWADTSGLLVDRIAVR